MQETPLATQFRKLTEQTDWLEWKVQRLKTQMAMKPQIDLKMEVKLLVTGLRLSSARKKKRWLLQKLLKEGRRPLTP